MELLQLLLLILIFIAQSYWIFVKDYLQEKGKNAATKEDIEEITKKIENIKNTVQTFHSARKELLDQNKIALLHFYDEFLHLSEHHIRNVHITLFDLSNPDKIKEQIEILHFQQATVEKAFWRLCLFESKNTSFLDSIRDIHLQLELRLDNAMDYLSHLEQLSISIKIDEKGKASAESIKDYEEIIDDYYIKIESQEICSTNLPNKLMHIIQIRFTELYS